MTMIASDFTATSQERRTVVFPGLMAPLLSIVDFLLFLSLLAALKAFRDHRRRGGLLYPPGPRPVPLIGNLLDIPRESSWLAYTELAKKYGASPTFSESEVCYKRNLQAMSCHSTYWAESSSFWAPPRPRKVCSRGAGTPTLIAQ